MRTLSMFLVCVGVPIVLFQLHPVAGVAALAANVGYIVVKRGGGRRREESTVFSD
jgi:hypothetical protein